MNQRRILSIAKPALLKAFGRCAGRRERSIATKFADVAEAASSRLFPAAFSDRTFQETKFALARILFGLVVAWRYAWILWSLGPYSSGYLEASQWYTSIFACSFLFAMGALICVGLATRIALAGYALTVMLFDAWLSVETLGSMVGIFCAFMLLLGGAQRRISLDACLRRVSRIWNASFWHGRGDFNVAMTVGFLGVAVLHLLAATLHFSDPAWQNGATLKLLLTTSYLSPHFELFRAFEASHPGWMSAVSTVGGIGQLAWQLTMIPLMLSGWRVARAFVILWGWGFHLASLFFLDLSYLPPIEIILWSCLFINPKLWPFSRPSRAARKEGSHQTVNGRARPYRVALSTWVLLVVVLSISWSYATHWPSKLRWRFFDKICNNCNRGLYYVGLAPPNVFNESDLGLGNKWPVLYRVAPDGDVQQVPLNGIDGERLWYHRSDTIYFGNHMRWRRRAIQVPSAELAEHDELRASLERLIVFDFRQFQSQHDGPIHTQSYCVDFYESPMNQFQLPVSERTKARIVSHYEVQVFPDDTVPRTAWLKTGDVR